MLALEKNRAGKAEKEGGVAFKEINEFMVKYALQ